VLDGPDALEDACQMVVTTLRQERSVEGAQPARVGCVQEDAFELFGRGQEALPFRVKGA
jgi:hypothetical protein